MIFVRSYISFLSFPVLLRYYFSGLILFDFVLDSFNLKDSLYWSELKGNVLTDIIYHQISALIVLIVLKRL